MNYNFTRVVFQEVPDEISLAVQVAGCRLRCPGCHSPFSWNADSGEELNPHVLSGLIARHRKLITCVAFMGGEWEEETMVALLKQTRECGLKTCLYTGQEEVSLRLREQLDFLKTGSYRRELGGLESPTTNQKFIDVRTGKILNHRFQH